MATEVKVAEVPVQRYKCPKCGGTNLRAEITVIAHVYQDIDESDAYAILEDLDLGAGFYGDEIMTCQGDDALTEGSLLDCLVKDTDCGYSAKAEEFLV